MLDESELVLHLIVPSSDREKHFFGSVKTIELMTCPGVCAASMVFRDVRNELSVTHSGTYQIWSDKVAG